MLVAGRATDTHRPDGRRKTDRTPRYPVCSGIAIKAPARGYRPVINHRLSVIRDGTTLETHTRKRAPIGYLFNTSLGGLSKTHSSEEISMASTGVMRPGHMQPRVLDLEEDVKYNRALNERCLTVVT